MLLNTARQRLCPHGHLRPQTFAQRTDQGIHADVVASRARYPHSQCLYPVCPIELIVIMRDKDLGFAAPCSGGGSARTAVMHHRCDPRK